MGYMHINNLYKDKRILDFKECYALLKVHGTSANISFKDNNLHFFAGGASHSEFVKLFDENDIRQKFIEVGHDNIVLYGEAYGGKMQGMRETYGDSLRFIVFDVAINDHFVSVEVARRITERFGLEFVPYERIPATIEAIEIERLKPDRLAVLRGISYYEGETLVNPRVSEGIVLRPITEYIDHRGNRVICKHKNDNFQEVKSKRPLDEKELAVLTKEQEIVDEWVTPMRLEHVLQKFTDPSTEHIPQIIEAMYEDVVREAKDEIVVSKSLRKFIGAATAKLFKRKLQETL